MSNPLPATIIRADTPVVDCVRFMRDHSIGGVCIVSDDTEASLIGIFTMGDLLRHFDVIQSGGHWQRPVRTVMNANVITLDSTRVSEAADVMCKNGVGYLPIVSPLPGNKKRVVGILQMKDLFHEGIEAKKRKTQEFPEEDTKKDDDPIHDDEENEQENVQLISTLPSRQKTPMAVSLITRDPSFSKLMILSFSAFLFVSIKRIPFDETIQNPLDTLIFDLDGVDPNFWPTRIKEIHKSSLVKLIAVVFDPSTLSPQMTQTLDRLKKVKNFWIFEKPVGLFQLIQIVNNLKN